MSKRRLKRQLNLLQLVMLGTAGTIAAEIFVLTGHAIGLIGPAAVLAFVVAGLLNMSIALNYCELATMYPVTGGGVTYVREAWGPNLLTFLVGSLDCLSSCFYAALSAVGFAYSLQVVYPAVPIVPTALVVIGIFVVLNILNVTNVANVQIVLGSILLFSLAVFVVAGFVSPGGFRWSTFLEGDLFIHQGVGTNLVKILNTVALVYCAYIGYEIIAHDAEEAKNPSRNIPVAILVSVTVCMALYVLVPLVIMGTVPWQTVAGSETALTDVVGRFLPVVGVPMMVVAGMIATLTSVNAALLSGTREALSLGRAGVWPRIMSELSRYRTPYVACWAVGAVTALVAVTGMVDFLSYVSSTGFLFVLFWSNLAMVRLRRIRPHADRPFKVPLFPVTPIVGILTCALIITFSSAQSLLFLGGVLGALVVVYYTQRPLQRLVTERVKALEATKDRILVPVANPRTALRLGRLAISLAEASEETSICLLTVVPKPSLLKQEATDRLAHHVGLRYGTTMQRVADEALRRNVPLYTRVRPAESIAEGILQEVTGNVRLVLMGWPGPLDPKQVANHPVKVVLQRARAHVAVLLDRGLDHVERILVPVGGGFHSRLAVRLAYEIALACGARVTAIQVFTEPLETEELQDRMNHLQDVIEDSLGQVPPEFSTRLVRASDVLDGVVREAQRAPYDLMIVGASTEWLSRTRLFGALSDEIADRVPCSVLLARRHEAAAISWIRRRTHRGEAPVAAGSAAGLPVGQEAGVATGPAAAAGGGRPVPAGAPPGTRA